MRKCVRGFWVLVFLLGVAGTASALPVGLSGAVSGPYIDADGASFAQAFFGQTVSGTLLTGQPTGPLMLNPTGGALTVAFWAGSNSILPQPNNRAPLSILLDARADAISWRMGFADMTGLASGLTVDFFDDFGNLVHSLKPFLQSGYANYSFSGFGSFWGFSIYNNNDLGGLRFQNFDYTPGGASPVPEPATLLLLGFGLSGVGAFFRKRARA